MRLHEKSDKLKHSLHQAAGERNGQSDGDENDDEESDEDESYKDNPSRRSGHIHLVPLVKCTWNGCGRTLSSPYALKVHIAKVHRQEKPFICETCGQRYGYKHLLRQHIRRSHEQKSEEDTNASLSYLGPLLESEKRRRTVRERILPCPWARLSEGGEESECPGRFSRLYDLRRHMESAHALSVSDEELEHLFPEEVEQLPAKRIKHT